LNDKGSVLSSFIIITNILILIFNFFNTLVTLNADETQDPEKSKKVIASQIHLT